MTDSDLSEIPTEAIRLALCEVVENKLKSKNYKINVSSASQAGENNFIGIVYRVSFSELDDGKSENNPKHELIVKVAPQNEARRVQFFSRPLFLREIYLYDEVLPFFQQFEQSKGIVEENGFTEYPKCYKTISDELSECVFLEDLKNREFTMINRYTEKVTADHVHLLMQSLGKFHAISFALKDQQPEKFKELTSDLTELFIRTNDPFFKEYYDKLAELALSVVAGDGDDHLHAKMKKLFEKDAIHIAGDCLDLEAIGAATVISHGDTWQNNLMFRYDNNGKPVEICLLDWQVARHASCTTDIVYFMFNCTTKTLRDAHYDDFLKTYHDSLSQHIRRLGSDPEKLFPRELMMEHFHKFGRYGLILAMMLLQMITADSGNVVDLDGLADDIESGKTIDSDMFMSDTSRNRYSQRLRDVIIDMVRLQYI